MPPIIYLDKAFLSFGKKELFNNITLNIHPGDKICLIGRNGCGKSTLMKLLNKQLELDSGNIYFDPRINIGYLPQEINFTNNNSIKQELLLSISSKEQDSFTDKSYLVDIIIDKLQLDKNMIVGDLSGGYKRRVGLAKSLVEEPDILFLDEPTNHLDITSIEFLESYLNNYKGAFLLVSHDRSFLKNVTSKTLWINNKQIYVNERGYTDFDNFQERIFLEEQRKLNKLSTSLAKEELWLHQGVTARRKRNQQRLNNLKQLRVQLSQSNFNNKEYNKKIKFKDDSKKIKSKIAIEINNLSHSFEVNNQEKIIFKSFSLRVVKGEIIGLMGINGSGKSTLLNIITHKLVPRHGSVKIAQNTKIAYFDQMKNMLDLNKTPWQIMCPSGGDTVFIGTKTRHVCAYLKDFMFTSGQTQEKISNLSGGEKNRLLLAKTLATDANFFILDEPTNDLDMDTLDMLQEILSESKATIIIASHDRDFLDRLVTRTLLINNQSEIENYYGSYFDYNVLVKSKKQKAKNTNNNSKSTITKPTKLSYKYQRELEILMQNITIIEQEINKIENILKRDNLYLDSPEIFNVNSQKLEQLNQELAMKEQRWLELEEIKFNIEKN